MTLHSSRAIGLLLMGTLYGTSFATAAEQAVAVLEAHGPKIESNTLVFDSMSQASPHMQDMQKKLADPKERAAMRAQARASMPSSYPDLAKVLQIDTELEGKLFDLLADQQIAHQDRFFNRPPPTDARPTFMQDMSKDENVAKDQIRTLLGEQVYDRYVQYDATRMHRMPVEQFNALLSDADKLTLAQKEKMMVVARTQSERMIERIRPGRLNADDLSTYFRLSPEERQVHTLKRNIEGNEESFRGLLEEKKSAMAAARPILTRAQLEGYGRYYDGRIDSLRNWVRKARVSAGMSPDFDEDRPLRKVEEPLRFEGKVRLALSITIDSNEPVIVELTGDNGKKTEMFQVGAGLWAEATPTLWADGNGDVKLQYYEERGGKRVPISGMHGIGTQAAHANIQLGSGGGGGGLMNGSKSYAVMTDARLTPAP